MENFNVLGILESFNKSDGKLNLQVLTKDSRVNLKIAKEEELKLEKSRLYSFDVSEEKNEDRVVKNVIAYSCVKDIESTVVKDKLFRDYYGSDAIPYLELKEGIYSYVDRISCLNIKNLVTAILEDFEDKYFTYPAASKFHHAYEGGLAYHTLGILNLADTFLNNYKYLDKNYIYAGAILHDVAKTLEFSGVEETKYTVSGSLLGHLVMGNDIVYEYALRAGIEKTEEILILRHMIISHHGIPNYGAARKPQTGEALLLWYLDTLDSKFRALGDHLENVEEGEFTENLAILDRQRFYNPHKTKI